MKNIIYIIASLISLGLQAQAVIADTATPAPTEPTAVLDVQSANRGMIVPRLSDAAMVTLASTATEGLIIFNTDDKCYYGFQQGDWYNLDGNCKAFAPGSFIFTGFQSYQNPAPAGSYVQADKFAIVTLGDIPAGSIFYFTDKGWVAPTASSPEGEFYANEGVLRWTVGSQPIPARTEIVFYSPQNRSASFEWEITSPIPAVLDVGTVDNVGNSGFNGKSIQLSNDGDNILVFTATDDNDPLNNVDKFLVAIKMENDWESTATSYTTSAIPPGLINGSTALAILNNTNNQKIDCSVIYSGMTDDDIRSEANDYSNWSGTNNDPLVLPTGCSY